MLVLVPPAPLSKAASASLVANRFLYFWPASPSSKQWLRFDHRAQSWLTVPASNEHLAPEPRSGRSTTTYRLDQQDYILLLGGSRSPSPQIFDVSAARWLPPHSSFVEPDPLRVPLVTSFHSATLVELDFQKLLFVVGGLHFDTDGGHKYVLPQLRICNLRTHRWSRAIHLPARYKHSAILLPLPSSSSPQLLIVGGRDSHGTHTSTSILVDVRRAIAATERAPNQPTEHAREDWWAPLVVQGPHSGIGPFLNKCQLALHDNIVFICGTACVENADSGAPGVWALVFHRGWVQYKQVCEAHAAFQAAESRFEVNLDTFLAFAIINTGSLASKRACAAATETGGAILILASGLSSDISRPPLYGLLPLPLVSLGIIRDQMRQLTQAAISFLPSLSGTLSSLLPPLWDGLTPHQPHQAIGHLYSPTDFSIFSSTPNAPPLPAHIPILASRSPYFRSLLLSGLSESRTCSAHFSEPYIIIYTVLYFIYTDTLPSFLLQRGWDTQGDIIAATPWANKIDTIAAGALLAAGAFILPGLSAQLRSVLRRTDSGSRIAPWVFRAAYLTSSESRQRVQSRKQAADSRLMESDPGERWLEEMIRTAETSSSEAEEDPTPFLGEVVEWCYQERSAVERRFKEVMQCQEELDGESGEVEIEEFVWAEFQRLMDDKEASMRSQVHV